MGPYIEAFLGATAFAGSIILFLFGGAFILNCVLPELLDILEERREASRGKHYRKR